MWWTVTIWYICHFGLGGCQVGNKEVTDSDLTTDAKSLLVFFRFFVNILQRVNRSFLADRT